MGGNAAVLMEHFLYLMPLFVTMRKAGRSAHVAGYKNLLVFGDYAAGTPPVAGSPFGDGFANLHKILIPAWPLIPAHFILPQFVCYYSQYAPFIHIPQVSFTKISHEDTKENDEILRIPFKYFINSLRLCAKSS
jgi:hypothetical protein